MRIRHLLLALPVTVLSSGVVRADVTADDVWENVQTYLETFGGTVNGTPLRNGDTLSLTAPKHTFTFPFDIGDLTVAIDSAELVENGDGTVTIRYPNPVTYSFSGSIRDFGPFSGKLALGYDSYDVRVSGAPGDMTYDTDLRGLTLTIPEASTAALPDMVLALTAQSESYTASTRVEVGEMVTITQDSATGPSTFATLFEAVDSMIDTSEGAYGATTTRGQIVMPIGGPDILNLSAALRNGMFVEVVSTVDSVVSNNMTVQNGEVIARDNSQNGRQTTTMRLSGEGLFVEGDAADFQLEIEDRFLFPEPISVNADIIAAKIDLPLNASPDPQDFGLSLTFSGVTLGETLWSLLDPDATLPRDPMALNVAMFGTGTSGVDLLDFLALAEIIDPSQLPVEIDMISLDTLSLDAVGAQLRGAGLVRLDNSDTTTIPGFPRPEGTLSFSMTGVNALLDKLIALDLLSTDDAMGARMGLGMFTTATGDDAMTSTIEFTPDGQIIVNGQRIR